MKTAVIYQSKYGSTETYAKWIAEDLQADLWKADQIKPEALQKYDTVVYGGGVYAGNINGIAVLTKNINLLQDKALYLFTVGASDVNAPETPKARYAILEQKLPSDLLHRLNVYHLRGGMQFTKLSLPHRLMMRMFIKMLRDKPESERTPDEQGMLETISRDTDFTDRKTIAPLVADIKASVKAQ